MLKDGTYAAWFKTPLGQGTGTAHVADGRIWGQDCVMTYSGKCEVNGDRFTAVLRPRGMPMGTPFSAATTNSR